MGTLFNLAKAEQQLGRQDAAQRLLREVLQRSKGVAGTSGFPALTHPFASIGQLWRGERRAAVPRSYATVLDMLSVWHVACPTVLVILPRERHASHLAGSTCTKPIAVLTASLVCSMYCTSHRLHLHQGLGSTEALRP